MTDLAAGEGGRFLILDVDGVLNAHKRMRNGYCQMKRSCVLQLCRILDECPDVQIILSSAWRYMVTSGNMTPKGFEYLFCLFWAPFASVNGRVAGCTVTDEQMAEHLGLMDKGAGLDYLWLKENGSDLRAVQIESAAITHSATFSVVLDDIQLDVRGGIRFVKTEPLVGITKPIADEVIRLFWSAS